ncbi:MAG: lasso peptide biosynthesis protein [Planctomycetes bacterium]|nr:lasso peptide biosynthesis protein [Planctomycetota bacterium]
MRVRALRTTALLALLALAALTATVFAQDPPRAEEYWFGIWVRESRVGMVHVRLTPTQEEGKPAWELRTVMEMRMPLQHGEGHKHSEETSVYSAARRPLRVHEDENDNGELKVTQTTYGPAEAVQEQKAQGRTAVVRVALKEPVASDDEMELRRLAAEKPLVVGLRHHFVRVSFDAQKTFGREVVLEAAADLPDGGKGFRAVFTREDRPGERLVALADATGAFHQLAVGPLLARRIPQSEAGAQLGGGSAVLRSEVPCVPPVVGDDRDRIRSMRLAVEFLDEAAGEFPADGYQDSTRQGRRRELTLKANRPKGDPALKLPVTDKGVASFLLATPEIQSDAPEVKKRAQEILDGETGAGAAAAKLCRWVFEHMQTQHDAVALSSAEALRQLKGNCTEHASAFVGLARAAGLPAREMFGFGFSGSAFVLHAWAEAWVGRWLPVDPSTGDIGTPPFYISIGPSQDAEGVMPSAGLRMAVIAAIAKGDARFKLVALDLDGQQFEAAESAAVLGGAEAGEDPGPARVVLSSGLSFDGELVGLEQGRLVFRTLYGRTSVERARLLRIEFGGRAVRGATFSDPRLGVGFRVPDEGWRIEEPKVEGAIHRCLFTSTDGLSAGLLVVEPAQTASLEAYVKLVQALPGTQGATIGQVRNREIGAAPARVPAIAWDFEQPAKGGVVLRFEIVAWRWRERYYRLALWTTPDRLEAAQPVFQGIRDSVTMLAPAK